MRKIGLLLFIFGAALVAFDGLFKLLGASPLGATQMWIFGVNLEVLGIFLVALYKE